MEFATLGNTGLLVSKLCFGTMTFGDGRGLFKAISAVDQAGATASAASPCPSHIFVRNPKEQMAGRLG
jgi:aryl-alcohol dehydrogenase-like predicted oxidoreductase